jgi:hypothetical protein
VMLSKVLNTDIELVEIDPKGQIKSAMLWIGGYLMAVDVRTPIAGSRFSSHECLLHAHGVSHGDGDLYSLEARDIDAPFHNLHYFVVKKRRTGGEKLFASLLDSYYNQLKMLL